MIRRISFCVTNFNRFEMLFRSFADILDDERIEEVCISDDCSDKDVVDKISKRVDELCNPKISLFLHSENRGVYVNKMQSVMHSKSEFCIVGDSDNIYGTDYLDRVYEKIWNDDLIFNPEKALPVFDFSNFSGVTLTKENISEYIPYYRSETFLNLMNFFVNREAYLEVWDKDHEPVGSDSIYFSYLWLKSGKRIHALPGLQYIHTVHNGSHYSQNATVSTPMVFDIVEKLKQLR